MFRKSQRGFTLLELLTTVLFLGLLGGWVANIVKLAHLNWENGSQLGLGILRAIGIFIAPLGGVLGWV